MGTAPIVLVDLEATLDRHWFGSWPVLRTTIPPLEPPTDERVRRSERELAAKLRPDHWTKPERITGPNEVATLLPYYRDGRLVLMTERPPEPRALTERRLAAAGFAGVPLHHVSVGEHPAYGKRRIARAVRPALTVEDDLRIAEFLATFGYETILVDDRHNRGPIRSVSLMRIARADLARVLSLRLEPETWSGEASEPAFAPA